MKLGINFTYLTFANLNSELLKNFVNCMLINIYLHRNLQMYLEM